MFDGINGQSSLFFLFLIITLGLNNHHILNFLIFLVLLIFIFLIYNIRSKIFLGDNGTHIHHLIKGTKSKLFKINILTISPIILYSLFGNFVMSSIFLLLIYAYFLFNKVNKWSIVLVVWSQIQDLGQNSIVRDYVLHVHIKKIILIYLKRVGLNC